MRRSSSPMSIKLKTANGDLVSYVPTPAVPPWVAAKSKLPNYQVPQLPSSSQVPDSVSIEYGCQDGSKQRTLVHRSFGGKLHIPHELREIVEKGFVIVAHEGSPAILSPRSAYSPQETWALVEVEDGVPTRLYVRKFPGGVAIPHYYTSFKFFIVQDNFSPPLLEFLNPVNPPVPATVSTAPKEHAEPESSPSHEKPKKTPKLQPQVPPALKPSRQPPNRRMPRQNPKLPLDRPSK